MSMKHRSSMPGRQSVRSTSPIRCPRGTADSCAQWPWVNSRGNWPNVAQAYTPPNNRCIPPERITSRSSILSAPAAIPAMIEVSFGAGFTPAEATFVFAGSIRTLSVIKVDRPVCSVSAITGTKPA